MGIFFPWRGARGPAADPDFQSVEIFFPRRGEVSGFRIPERGGRESDQGNPLAVVVPLAVRAPSGQRPTEGSPTASRHAGSDDPPRGGLARRRGVGAAGRPEGGSEAGAVGAEVPAPFPAARPKGREA